METLTSTEAAPRARVRSRAAGSSWLRAGVCAAGLLISGAPALAAGPAPVDNPALTHRGQLDPLPGERGPAHTPDPTLPREPDPTRMELPDEQSARELKGEYGLGLGLLVLGGVVVAAGVIALLLLLMRRTWSDTETGAPSRH